MILIGYSGHAFVVAHTANQLGYSLTGYMDKTEKTDNPYDLKYLGSERSERGIKTLKRRPYFVSIGNNNTRERVQQFVREETQRPPERLYHPSAGIAKGVELGSGTLVSAGVVIQPLATVGRGCIINTGSLVEHECELGSFSHVAPGAVLAGNVRIGARTFVGANAVIIEDKTIGSDVTIGAGAVIINDMPDGVTVVGNPGKIIKGPDQA